jgi:hypothetical protein
MRRLVREKERFEITGVPQSSCFAKMAEGTFPDRRPLWRLKVAAGPPFVARVLDGSRLPEWVD